MTDAPRIPATHTFYILRHEGARLCKTSVFRGAQRLGAKVLSYDDEGKPIYVDQRNQFAVSGYPVISLQDLLELVLGLKKNTDMHVIRAQPSLIAPEGTLVDDRIEYGSLYRRYDMAKSRAKHRPETLHFTDALSPWVAFDIDHKTGPFADRMTPDWTAKVHADPGFIYSMIEEMIPPLAGVGMIVWFSASQEPLGGNFRCRVWCMLSQPLYTLELRAWAGYVEGYDGLPLIRHKDEGASIVDEALLQNPVQPIYTAVICEDEDGNRIDDPLGSRILFRDGPPLDVDDVAGQVPNVGLSPRLKDLQQKKATAKQKAMERIAAGDHSKTTEEAARYHMQKRMPLLADGMGEGLRKEVLKSTKRLAHITGGQERHDTAPEWFREMLLSTIHEMRDDGRLKGEDGESWGPDDAYIAEQLNHLDVDWQQQCELIDEDPELWSTERTPEEEYDRLMPIRRDHRSKRKKLPEVDPMTFLRGA